MSYSSRCALFVALGGFIFGFDAAIIGGVTPFITELWNLNAWQVGSIVASPTFSAMFSALLVTTLADKYGRKPVLVIISLIYAISAGLSAFAPNYSTLLLARFIGGFGFGSLVLAPIYISEIAPPEKRGRLVSFNQFNIVIGLSAAFFASYFIVALVDSGHSLVGQLALDEYQWRWMLGLELLPGLVYVFLLLKIPESPRWLLLKSEREKALSIYEKLLGSTSLAQQTIDSLAQHTVETIAPIKDRVVALFSKHIRFALLLGFAIAITQQITGINAIFFYAQTIFEQSGVGQNAAFAQAVVIGLTNVIFTVFAMVCIDKFGRKPLLLGGLFFIFVAMSICAYEFHNATYNLASETVEAVTEEHLDDLKPIIDKPFSSDLEFNAAIEQYIGKEAAEKYSQALLNKSISLNSGRFLFGIILFVAAFAFSLGPVMWVLLPELFPDKLRGIGMAVLGLTNSLVSFLVQFLFLIELKTLGATMTFLLFGIFALIGLVIVAKYLPETKGKSLEELEDLFSR